MRAPVVALGAMLCLAACGSSSSSALEPEETRPAAQPVTLTPTDPRVSELQVLVAELLDRVEVLNARIAKVESGAPAPRVKSTAVVAQVERPVTQEVTPAAMTTDATADAAPVQIESQSQRAPIGATGIGDAYRQALEMYGKGRIDDARSQFQAVFDADPSGDLADNALYWIGETYFATGKFNESVRVYSKVATDYSDQNKAPDAVLKMGMAQAKLGDLALARKTFEQLVAKYPYSTAAAAAKYELKRIKY